MATKINPTVPTTTGVHKDVHNNPDLRQYPKPVSPPYPDVSKAIELKRAMSASSRSSLFAFTQSHIVFEDDWLVIVNKPAGVYCETLLPSYSAFSSTDGDASAELHLANRLDRDTSGLMVITKSHKVAAKLVKAFTEHTIKKTYLALCIGQYTPPEWRTVRVVSGHGRSKHGAWRVYSVDDIGRTLPGGSFVKNMETFFQVLSNSVLEPVEPIMDRTTHNDEKVDDTIVVVGKRSSAEGEADDEGMQEQVEPIMDRTHNDGKVDDTVAVVGKRSSAEGEADDEGMQKKNEILLRAYPRSGRTHQIRLHCQYLGMPIKGDVKYGGVDCWNGVECEFHSLHAESLSFEHPVTGGDLLFHVPPTPSWSGDLF